MKIHLLAIEHRQGLNFYPCASEEILHRELATYVRACWNDIRDLNDIPRQAPADDDEAISIYFDVKEDESYVTEEVELIAN